MSEDAGDDACWAHLLCPECGAVIGDGSSHDCPRMPDRPQAEEASRAATRPDVQHAPRQAEPGARPASRDTGVLHDAGPLRSEPRQ